MYNSIWQSQFKMVYSILLECNRASKKSNRRINMVDFDKYNQLEGTDDGVFYNW